MTAPSARQVTVCASLKGGQGCTTIAAVLAVLAARSNQPTLLLDTRGDAAAILGVRTRQQPARSPTRSPMPSNHATVYASSPLPAIRSTLRRSARSVNWSRWGIG